jgi:hypothetical protein
MSKSKKAKQDGTPPKKRNPLAMNPLMKKSHAHQKSNKSKRGQEKQKLKKELKKSQSESP